MPGTEPVCFTFGPLHLWCKSTPDEIWIAHEHIETDSLAETGDGNIDPPEDANWWRWSLKQTVKKAETEIQIVPVFPNLPVVVKPEYPFRITKDVSTRIYVRVPLWVQIKLGETMIVEIPTVVLSKTWFGTFREGELSYWISSAARKQIEPDISRPYLAICPIQIVNRSDEELLVDKICHRVEQLSLYLFEGQLWANETRVKFRGKNDVSEIEFKRKAPPDVPKAKFLTASRKDGHKGLTAKTFDSIKEITKFRFF